MNDPAEDRYVLEGSGPSAATRSPFQRDRARVLHSAGFRRLATKTQVHTAGTDDFLRTRLTHSLEVAQIARELGTRLGCDPDVVDVAGLAHDLGHPPFGHNGESALNIVAQPCGGFEGNAQTLRLLSRLEMKVLDADGNSAGLNLTRASLDAACKYPWQRREGTRKFGVYADDQPVFTWFRQGARPGRPCMEAQVMDWSDDVAYSVHDVEDALFTGFVTDQIEMLFATESERRALCEDAARIYSPLSATELEAELDSLLRFPAMKHIRSYDGSVGAQVALKSFTSAMVGRLVDAAVEATRDRYGQQPLRGYSANLVVPERERAWCALLKGVAWRYVMRKRSEDQQYARQRQILVELVEFLFEHAPTHLDPPFAAWWKEAEDDATRLRVVVDQVASLTDPGVVLWHEGLV
ncbi:deoxyguanosinetriphosphate triphosphohydrolase [Natronoglycomyces albus]|uniref:Deoxyguanosinetriphosphate triphosphohydrolase n=1 Tax=Natronoglycomyces albus TaxID=2811108 RepID=A0A895XKR4_9ACTN|nr:deoxyguanosinetriphosphate triphosphohydrolase [Natronoglycomyces albus]QSB05914.1 deoxyguanosinetriphosphate triphosphohydrolase [Natronoglycomyces albus]